MKYAFPFAAVIALVLIPLIAVQIPGMQYLFGVVIPYLAFGLFVGGFLGGLLAKWGGMPALFTATAVLMVLWLVITWPLRPVGRSARS